MVRVKIGRMTDFPDGKVHIVSNPVARLAVIKLADSVHVLEDRCSHDDSTLDGGSVSGKRVICPRHGAGFDLATGGQPSMPAFAPIKAFPVTIENDEIFAEVT